MIRRSLPREVSRAPDDEEHPSLQIHRRNSNSAQQQQLQRKHPVHTFTVLVLVGVLYKFSTTTREPDIIAVRTSEIPAREQTIEDFSPRMVQLESNNDAERNLLSNVLRTQPLRSCVPMHKWQLPQFAPSSCNIMHETASQDLEFVACGGSRCAFRIEDAQGNSMILKTPKFKLDTFSSQSVEAGWLDTIAMERLTSSPFVLSIFGNCGVGQIIEVGRSSLLDLINVARLQGHDRMTAEDKLRIGIHLASGIADLHSIDGDVPSFAHNDVDPSQVILVDGVFKINDFHLGSIKYKDSRGNACPETPRPLRSWVDKMRAPEELTFKTDGYPNKYIHRDKADVWCLGNMLYSVLTKRWVFEGISTKEARAKITTGVQDYNTFEMVNRTDTFNRAMIEAIYMAWTYNPDERPTSRQIANFLKRHITEKKDDIPWRVSIPPLPPDYSYSDSDFRANFH